MKTIISEDSVILLNNLPREMYEKEKDTYNTEEINKKLFEVFRESEILKNCEDVSDFLDVIYEISKWESGSNAEYCEMIYKIFGIEKLNEILKEYNYFYDEVNGALNYIN